MRMSCLCYTFTIPFSNDQRLMTNDQISTQSRDNYETNSGQLAGIMLTVP